MAPHLSGKAGDVGRTGADNRLFLNAVFWVARHGCAWRALPARFGKHDTLRKRSRRWAQKGIWQRLFEAVQEPDLDWVMLDSTVVRAHAQAAGSRKKAASVTKPLAAAAAG
ncbi:Transposase [Hymenobacter psychrotolerans DSM 18569]|uniref:Transposase n=1 Tax=Hymenobacter psychrotolerans DSM 18569 TaxID=1121959 RepID=A0A1M6ZU26_9BACT|nr:Transposase [Hymenobacter psychrotolerans DSM 18569]